MSRTAREWEHAPELADEDFVSALVYTDEDIFAEEMARVKRCTWKLACHESEIAALNDYRTIDHAGFPLIVTRSSDGVIRTFINSCSHRAAQVLRVPHGNAANWTCLFHHWTYDNTGACVAIPREEEFAESGVCAANSGLREVRTAVRLGMVFVNLDDDAPAFDDDIGDALENVADVMGGPDLEVFSVHRSTINANWKQLMEVQMELYHEYLHFINRQVAMSGSGYLERKWRIYPNAHATLDPMVQNYDKIDGWTTRDEKLLPGLGPGEFRLVDLFPDTTIAVRTTVMRIDTMSPISPSQTLLECRGLGIKGEPDEDRAMRVNHHNQYWGPFGRNFPEDCIAPECIERTNRDGAARWGIFARHEDNKAQDDVYVRTFYREWSRRMGRRASDPARRIDGEMR